MARSALPVDLAPHLGDDAPHLSDDEQDDLEDAFMRQLFFGPDGLNADLLRERRQARKEAKRKDDEEKGTMSLPCGLNLGFFERFLSQRRSLIKRVLNFFGHSFFSFYVFFHVCVCVCFHVTIPILVCYILIVIFAVVIIIVIIVVVFFI